MLCGQVQHVFAICLRQRVAVPAACHNHCQDNSRVGLPAMHTNHLFLPTAAGKTLVFKVTSANGSKAAFQQATAKVPVGYTDGACAVISAKAKCECCDAGVGCCHSSGGRQCVL